MRNAARGVGALYKNQLLPRNAWTPQLDATPLARDSVVALLVGTPVAINDGEDARDPRSRATTASSGSSQLPPVVPDRQWQNGGGDGATRLEGSRATTSSSTRAYRIGCVTDTNLVESPGKDQQIMVSVAVEGSPLTLLERAGVGAYMKPRDDDADADEDEGEAARDDGSGAWCRPTTWRCSVGRSRRRHQLRMRPAPHAKITNCNRTMRRFEHRVAARSPRWDRTTARATRVRSAWAP